MAETSRRRAGEILRALFDILLGAPDGLQAKDALARLSTSVRLTEYEHGEFPSGGRRFEKIARFATVDTVKAGWLAKSKGRWEVTEAGRVAHGRFRDPEEFYREAIRLYKEWRRTQPRDSEEESLEVESEAIVERQVALTFETAEEQSWLEIEQFLEQMPPYEFQELVASLLRGMGYHVASVAAPGKDGGVDIIAFPDPLGTQSPRIKVQVKRHKDSVSSEGLRAFLSVLSGRDVGIFVNTGGFTRDATELARGQEQRQVTLVDTERLVDLWIEHYPKLDQEARNRLPLRPVHFLAPQ